MDNRTDLNLISVAAMLAAITRSAGDPHELAEVTFLEVARVTEPDVFEIGLFGPDGYQILIRVVEGTRVENKDIPEVHTLSDLLTWVQGSGESILFSDYETEKDELPAVNSLTPGQMPQSGLFIPLRFGDRVLGVLSLRSNETNAFTENDRELLSILAASIAPALATTSLASEIESLTIQMLLVQQVSRLLMTLEPLNDRMERIVAILSQVLEIEQIALYEVLDGEIELRTQTAGKPLTGGEETIPELVRAAIASGETQSSQFELDPGLSNGETTLEAEWAFPLNIVDHRMGALHLCCPAGTSFKGDQLSVLETVSQQLAFAILEARNYAQHQQEAWVTTVLLEVARHAAQPGDPLSALQAVLQLAGLLVGTEWTLLLTPSADGETLQIATSAGLKRQQTFMLSDLEFSPAELGLHGTYVENELPIFVDLPPPMKSILKDDRALGMVLSDGQDLLGLLLTENEEISGKQPSLMAGISHQVSLRLENTRLIERAARQRSFERELAMARDIQVSFLPSSLPELRGWELGVAWRVAREVGGDFYDFIVLPDGEHGARYGLAIADVADKGIPAALYMALSRTLLRTLAMEFQDPGECLQRVNQHLIQDTHADLFVSVFYGIWEPEIGRLQYANAGHNPPLLFTPRQRGELLREHGMVLGVQSPCIYKTRTVEIEKEQLLVLYTDGVTDALDENEEFFGIQRLESLVLGLSNWQAQFVADQIEDRVLRFTGRRDLYDDLTTIALHR